MSLRASSFVCLPLCEIVKLTSTLPPSFIVMIAQQFSGINIMAFYSSTIFSDAGYDAKSSLLFSMGYGLIMFLMAVSYASSTLSFATSSCFWYSISISISVHLFFVTYCTTFACLGRS